MLLTRVFRQNIFNQHYKPKYTGRKPEKEIVKWLSLEELNEEIRKRKICSEVLRKLFFIKEVYKGALFLRRQKRWGLAKSQATALWNEKGLEGLKPNYGGGRPSELSQKDEKAKELNIVLIYLPPCSPDLNPIEQIWRAIKRVLFPPLLIKTLEDLKEVISSSFYQLTQKLC